MNGPMTSREGHFCQMSSLNSLPLHYRHLVPTALSIIKRCILVIWLFISTLGNHLQIHNCHMFLNLSLRSKQFGSAIASVCGTLKR